LKAFIVFIGKSVWLIAGLLILFAVIDFIIYVMEGMSIHNTLIQQLLVLLLFIIVLAVLFLWSKRKQ